MTTTDTSQLTRRRAWPRDLLPFGIFPGWLLWQELRCWRDVDVIPAIRSALRFGWRRRRFGVIDGRKL